MRVDGNRVAVIGAGMAGAACASLLADAGVEVQVFDKARGVGGRMATRRAEWTAEDGTVHRARFDHGAPGFSARADEFARVVEQADRHGLLSRWVPRLAPGSHALLDHAALWVATPDMPAWCRALLDDLPVHTHCAIDTLRYDAAGWSLHSGGATVGERFDAVIVAVPAQQAATLLRPHRSDWALKAQALPMVPSWVLMAVTNELDSPPAWDLACPRTGHLAWIERNDAKPGRMRVPGQATWVVHATAQWSQAHLEAPAAEVQAALQAELTAWLGRPLTWHYAVAHRWRYATAFRVAREDEPSGMRGNNARAGRCWWDAPLGLGVCGDALGGAGVEGAWRSARELARTVIAATPGLQTPGCQSASPSSRAAVAP